MVVQSGRRCEFRKPVEDSKGHAPALSDAHLLPPSSPLPFAVQDAVWDQDGEEWEEEKKEEEEVVVEEEEYGDDFDS